MLHAQEHPVLRFKLSEFASPGKSKNVQLDSVLVNGQNLHVVKSEENFYNLTAQIFEKDSLQFRFFIRDKIYEVDYLNISNYVSSTCTANDFFFSKDKKSGKIWANIRNCSSATRFYGVSVFKGSTMEFLKNESSVEIISVSRKRKINAYQ